MLGWKKKPQKNVRVIRENKHELAQVKDGWKSTNM
jgi:hypothetical protein